MKRIYFSLLILLIAFVAGCKKDSSIGADILPGDDLLNVRHTDTLTVNSKTIADSFLRTDKLAKNYLGVINDTKFGFQQASIVMELDKPTAVYDDTLNTTYTIDSVVMFLKYNSVYGDTTVPQSFDVSTIGNKINENQAYYSNTTAFPATGNLGGVSNYYFTPTTNPVHISTSDTVGLPSIVRIKLNNTLGNTIMSLGQTVLRDSSLFKNAFPGVRVDNSTTIGKAMAEVDLSSPLTSIAIFYKDKYNKAKEMRMYSAIVKYTNGVAGTRVNGINLFSNTLSGDVQNTISSGQMTDSINYILGQGGTLLKLSLPTLPNLGKIAVNQAVITVAQVMQNSNLNYTCPFYFIILKRNADGNLDILSTGDGGSIIDTSGVDIFGNKIARYNFNISKYMQSISVGTTNNTDLYLATYRYAGADGTVNVLNSIGTPSINIGYIPSRVIVAGSNYSDPRFKLKFNLTYTLIR
ncbi:MAG TPA: DUF4270 family protein [Chitinophagales bacterium]|nr:DUF4270 family protein [Chitinophagales bacterium]